MAETAAGSQDLAARARWHLELGYAESGPVPEDWYGGDDEDGYLGDRVQCWACEEGTVIECCDDLCHGQGWCMHGDNRMCRVCGGEGFL